MGVEGGAGMAEEDVRPLRSFLPPGSAVGPLLSDLSKLSTVYSVALWIQTCQVESEPGERH